MLDLLLGTDGDLFIGEKGDIVLTDSVAQAIQVRLRWFLSEWKYNPAFGVPYYEEILVKNASKLRTRQLIREQIMNVAEAKDVPELTVFIDSAKRRMGVNYCAVTDFGQLREEVGFDV